MLNKISLRRLPVHFSSRMRAAIHKSVSNNWTMFPKQQSCWYMRWQQIYTHTLDEIHKRNSCKDGFRCSVGAAVYENHFIGNMAISIACVLYTFPTEFILCKYSSIRKNIIYYSTSKFQESFLKTPINYMRECTCCCRRSWEFAFLATCWRSHKTLDEFNLCINCASDNLSETMQNYV